MERIGDKVGMLRAMSPRLTDGAWMFQQVSPEDLVDQWSQMRGIFIEDEGVSAIVPAPADAPQAMRQITLDVYSALDGVGLTAAVSDCLARADIPCNVVAGYHHDHIFVPVAVADTALGLLQALSQDHQ